MYIDHRTYTFVPGNLTEQGKEQVRKTAERLAEAGVEFKCIVSSDLKRAMDSAHIIAERLHLPITPMKELRERDWGIYTGMAVAEAAKKYRIDGIWRFPDSSAETGVGAWLWASGSQRCMGARPALVP